MGLTAADLPTLAAHYARSTVEGVRRRGLIDGVETYTTFVGYPRSGHSLLAWLLDAHPQTLIAPELDALRYVRAGFRKHQLYALLLWRARQHRAEHGEATGRRYSYAVPGQWQGTFDDLRVIGDKKGGGTSMRLGQQPRLYDRLRRVVDDRLTFVHVVRNPFDNIATMSRRGGTDLATSADRYFFMAAAVASLQRRVPPQDWFATGHRDLVDDPRAVLTALCTFLGLGAPADYLDACAGIVHASPNRSRFDAPWTDDLVASVAERSAEVGFLRHFTFDEVAS